MVLECAHGGDNHRRRGFQPGLAAFDVEEFLGTEVRTETGFSYHVVDQFQCSLGRDHRVAAVGDIGKGAAVDEGRIVFQRLHQIRCQLVFEQHGHCAMRLQVTRAQRLAVTGVTEHDVAETLLQILQRGRQTENCHHFGSDDDVETVFTRVTVSGTAEGDNDVAQRTVVHVHHALPGDAARIDAKLVAVRDVVVDHRGEQVVRQCDRTEVTGEVQVDVFHRHNLCVTAARRAALDAEHRSERGFTQTDHRLLADVVQRIAEAHGRRGLAFAGGSRVDRRDEDQLAVFFVFQAVDIFQRHFGLVVTIRHQMLFRDAQLLRNLVDALHFCRLGNFDVRQCHDGSSPEQKIIIDARAGGRRVLQP